MKVSRLVRNLAFCAVLLTGAGALFAAGGSQGGGGKKLTVVFMTHRTDRHQDGSLAARIKPFEDANNCTIELRSYTNFDGDMATMMTTKNYGDIISQIPSAVKMVDWPNFFEPFGTLEEYSRKYNWVERNVVNGQVYALPDQGTISGGMPYNKRIWRQAGITSLPKTPEEFIADLQKIKDNVPGVIPFYTLFNFDWCVSQWNNLIDSVSGNPNRERDMLLDKTEFFDPNGPYYKVYKLMFDIFSRPALHEPDPMTDDWEGSKPAIHTGKIATMMMGSWSVSQFKAVGNTPEDIGFMPPPFTLNGKQYAVYGAGGGGMTINKNSSPEVKAMAKKFVEWWISESGWAESEGGIPVTKGAKLPAALADDYAGVEMFSTLPVPAGLQGVNDNIGKTSGISPGGTETGNFKFAIGQAAFDGKPWSAVETMMKDWNKRWMDTLNANAELKAYRP